MRRTVTGLAGALALAAFGVVDTAGQEVKPAPKPLPAPKPAPDKGLTGLGTKVNDAPVAQQKANAAQQKAIAAQQEAMVAQWEQHFGPQIRQVFRSEMHFLRLVCEPTREQYDRIAADNETAVKAALRKFAEGLRGGAGNQFDPRAAFTAGIAKAARATLAPEQADRYDKELELRTAARKRMAVTNLVAAIDKALVLSADQREKLGEVLTANWDEAWNQTQLFIYAAQAQYLPQMPDAKILPILTEAQRTLWRGIPKTNVRFGGFAFFPGMAIEDEAWDEKPAPKAVEKR